MTMNAPMTSRRLLAPLPLPTRQLLLAALAISLGVFIPWTPLRALIELPLALLAPGYAVVVATFGPRKRLDVVPTLALSAVLSMALYPLLSLFMYGLGIRVSEASILLGVDVLILLMVAAALVRTRLDLPVVGATRPSLQFDALIRAGSLWNGTRGGVRFLITVAIAVALLAVTMHMLPTPIPVPYTQLNLAGRWAHTDSIVYADPHQPQHIAFSVTNHTNQAQTYRIVPLFDTKTIWPGHVVSLAVGRSWTGTVSGYVPAAGCIHRLSINLYQGNDTQVLTSLTLWLRGTPGLPLSCQGH